MIGFEGYSERVQINSDGSSEKASPDEPEYSSAPSETCFVNKNNVCKLPSKQRHNAMMSYDMIRR